MVSRVLVATDRSETAEVAVRFAAEMAKRFEADLVLVQVVVPPAHDELAMAEELVRHAHELAGERGCGSVVVGEEPAQGDHRRGRDARTWTWSSSATSA